MQQGGGVRITWLGHATFLLRAADGTTVLVDPFVASNPSCPDDCKTFARLDYMAITHGHEDHVADAAAIWAAHEPTVVAMVEVGAWLESQGVDGARIEAMNKGGTVALDGLSVTMVNAHHSNSTPGAGAPGYGGEAAGLILAFGDGTRIYHAGDTAVFGDMRIIGELYAPDIALLPIGDRFTMGPREAALACELLGVRRVVPMHYGTWPILTGTPEALATECAARHLDVEIVTMRPGDTLG
jgi:L-ascorbate metabolism protein UlaG (beta-lactamase superfamily)